MIGSSDITQVGMLLGACATLGGVIAALWRQMLTHFGHVEEKLKDCEDDRQNLWECLADQAGHPVEELQRRKRE
jgi:hypothetical protein